MNGIKIIPLGGIEEIGKNITVFESNNDIIIVDCGVSFPDEDMLGIDLVIPDMTYLEANKSKIRGLFLTHGHEDHIGSIPYLLKKVGKIPIYGAKFTLALVLKKLKEHKINDININIINSTSKIKAGKDFNLEFIDMTHSIVDSLAIVIKTASGNILHTGDWKIDYTPVNGKNIDLYRLGEYGKEGIDLLLCDSTNTLTEGSTISEKKVLEEFQNIFKQNKKKRITIATFSSNINRIQNIINVSVENKRKVAFTGRSMLNVIETAIELEYVKVPKNTVIDINEVKKYQDEKITIITTGSQGEPMSALYRMADNTHKSVHLDENDIVIFSSSIIPGNELLINDIVDKLKERNIEIIQEDKLRVHVSGHACKEELKLMHSLVKPKYFMPVHGERKHLVAHKEIAMDLGLPEENVILTSNGKITELNKHKIEVIGEVQTGQILVDGLGIGDVGALILRERKILSTDGVINIIVTIDSKEKRIKTGPDIISKGFIYIKESDNLIYKIKGLSKKIIRNQIDNGITDWRDMKKEIVSGLSGFIFKETKRRPMIIPIIINI